MCVGGWVPAISGGGGGGGGDARVRAACKRVYSSRVCVFPCVCV